MRTNATITDLEDKAYTDWCDKHGVIAHDEDSGRFIVKYFEETWKEDITEANLDLAFPVIKDRLKFFAPSQQEFLKLHSGLSAEEKESFKAWKGERGLKDTFQTSVAILSWLKAHSFKVTQANLQLAIGQNKVYPYLEWDESARPRYDNPMQHKDDGKGFLPKDEVNLSPRDHARKNQEAAAKNNPTAPDSISVLEGQA